MDSKDYLHWCVIKNTVSDRLKENSLVHTFSSKNKIRKSTRLLNKELKKYAGNKSYSQFRQCKKKILAEITEDVDVSDESDFNNDDYKIFYDSFDVSCKNESKTDIIDDFYLWLFVEKKGRNHSESEFLDKHHDEPHIWEPSIDISIIQNSSNHENLSDRKTHTSTKKIQELNGGVNKQSTAENFSPSKSPMKTNCNNIKNGTSASTGFNKDIVNNVDSKVSLKKSSPAIQVKESKSSKTEKVVNRKCSKDVKRNLTSAIKSISSKTPERFEEEDWNDEFVLSDFQAQRTQIFSDTISDVNQKRSSRSISRLRLSQNEISNQHRDSGIEEDSRDENTKYENLTTDRKPDSKKMVDDKTESSHAVIGNKENKMDCNGLEHTIQENISSEKINKKLENDVDELIEKNKVSNIRHKHPLKILGEEKVTMKYKIINNTEKDSKPIVEEKQISESKLVDENVDNDLKNKKSECSSESDAEYIDPHKVEIVNNIKENKESTDEYFDFLDGGSGMDSEDEENESQNNSQENLEVDPNKTNINSSTVQVKKIEKDKLLNKDLSSVTSKFVERDAVKSYFESNKGHSRVDDDVQDISLSGKRRIQQMKRFEFNETDESSDDSDSSIIDENSKETLSRKKNSMSPNSKKYHEQMKRLDLLSSDEESDDSGKQQKVNKKMQKKSENKEVKNAEKVDEENVDGNDKKEPNTMSPSTEKQPIKKTHHLNVKSDESEENESIVSDTTSLQSSPARKICKNNKQDLDRLSSRDQSFEITTQQDIAKHIDNFKKSMLTNSLKLDNNENKNNDIDEELKVSAIIEDKLDLVSEKSEGSENKFAVVDSKSIEHSNIKDGNSKSDKDEQVSANTHKHLSKKKKLDILASEESEESDDEAIIVNLIGNEKLSAETKRKDILESEESEESEIENSIVHLKSIERINVREIYSDSEEDEKVSADTQKRLAKLKKMNLFDSEESEDSEKEAIVDLKNKHKSSRHEKLNTSDHKDKRTEDASSKNIKKNLDKIKVLDDAGSSSDEEERKLEDQKSSTFADVVKQSRESEEENTMSSLSSKHLQKMIQSELLNNGEESDDSSTKKNYCNSDIDIEEHKISMPDDFKEPEAIRNIDENSSRSSIRQKKKLKKEKRLKHDKTDKLGGADSEGTGTSHDIDVVHYSSENENGKHKVVCNYNSESSEKDQEIDIDTLSSGASNRLKLLKRLNLHEESEEEESDKEELKELTKQNNKMNIDDNKTVQNSFKKLTQSSDDDDSDESDGAMSPLATQRLSQYRRMNLLDNNNTSSSEDEEVKKSDKSYNKSNNNISKTSNKSKTDCSLKDKSGNKDLLSGGDLKDSKKTCAENKFAVVDSKSIEHSNIKDGNSKSDKDEQVSANTHKHLSKKKKLDILASEESEESDDEAIIVNSKSIEYSNIKDNIGNEKLSAETKRKDILESEESEESEIENSIVHLKSIERINVREIYSDSEEDEKVSADTQKRLAKLKKMNLFDSEESEDSEKEAIVDLKNKHKSSRHEKLNTSDHKDKRTEDASSKNIKKNLDKIKVLDDAGSSSDEEERKLEDQKSSTFADVVKQSRESEEENTMSSLSSKHLQKMIQSELLNNGEESDDSSTKKNYCNSDIDIEEHKISMPDDFKELEAIRNIDENSSSSSIRQKKKLKKEKRLKHDKTDKLGGADSEGTGTSHDIDVVHYSSENESGKHKVVCNYNSDSSEKDQEIDIDTLSSGASNRLKLLKRLNLHEESEEEESDKEELKELTKQNNKMNIDDNKTVQNSFKKLTQSSDDDDSDESDGAMSPSATQRLSQYRRMNLLDNNNTSSSEDEEVKKSDKSDNKSNNNISKTSNKSKTDCSLKDKSGNKDLLSGGDLKDSKKTCAEIDDFIEVNKDVDGHNYYKNRKDIIINETQESIDTEQKYLESQEMFSSIEDLTEGINKNQLKLNEESEIESNDQIIASQIPATPQPEKISREKIVNISQLIKKESLSVGLYESTLTSINISDDEEIFLLEVPKTVFNKTLVGEKISFTKKRLKVGSHKYEAFKRKISPTLSCVYKSGEDADDSFKILNIRPMVSIVTRRKKHLDDPNENSDCEEPEINDEQEINEIKDLETLSRFTENGQTDVKSDDEPEIKVHKKKDKTKNVTNSKKEKPPKKEKLPDPLKKTKKEGKVTKKVKVVQNKFAISNFLQKETKNKEVKDEKLKENKSLERKLSVSIDENLEDEKLKENKSLKRKLPLSFDCTSDDEKIDTSLKLIKQKNPIKEATNATSDKANPKKKIKKDSESEVVKAESKKSKKIKTLKEENVDVKKVDDKLKLAVKSESKSKSKKPKDEPKSDKAKQRKTTTEQKFTMEYEDIFGQMPVTPPKPEPKPSKRPPKKRKFEEAQSSEAPNAPNKKQKKNPKAGSESKSAKPRTKKPASEKGPTAESATFQILQLIEKTMKLNKDKLDSSNSSFEGGGRYSALDIQRVSAKKEKGNRYVSTSSSDSSSDEGELGPKMLSRSFKVREKPKEEKKLKRIFFNE